MLKWIKKEKPIARVRAMKANKMPIPEGSAEEEECQNKSTATSSKTPLKKKGSVPQYGRVER